MSLPCLKPSSSFLRTYNKMQTLSEACRNQPWPFFWSPVYTCLSLALCSPGALGFFLFPEHTNLRAFTVAVPSPWDAFLSEAGSFLTLGPNLHMTFSETPFWITMLKGASILGFLLLLFCCFYFIFTSLDLISIYIHSIQNQIPYYSKLNKRRKAKKLLPSSHHPLLFVLWFLSLPDFFIKLIFFQLTLSSHEDVRSMRARTGLLLYPVVAFNRYDMDTHPS